jgi:hypothetical protein
MPSLSLSDEEVGSELRAQLHDLVGDMSPGCDLYATVVRAHATRRRRSRVLGGLAALAVGTAVAVPVAIETSNTAGQTSLRLSSYSLKLPARYKLAAFVSTPCQPLLVVEYLPGEPEASVSQADEPAVASAVNSAGGCVAMALVGPYVPGGPQTPTIDGIGGGQVAPDHHLGQPVQVGSYRALLGSVYIQGANAQGVPWPDNGTTQPVLDVTIPAAGEQVENLVIVAVGLSPAQLVSLVSSNLTAVG